MYLGIVLNKENKEISTYQKKKKKGYLGIVLNKETKPNQISRKKK